MNFLQSTKGIFKDKKIYPPTVFNVSLVIMIILHFISPLKILLHGYNRFISLPFLIFGAAFSLIADNQFKQHSTTVKPFEESDKLIVTGIFAVSRNPMYFGMALILLAVAIFLGSISPFVIVLIFIFLINEIFIKTEENMLKQKFAEE